LGRREIILAEAEMPALMGLRRKYAAKKPLAGAKIIGCIHMTIQTAVLIETLVDLGAEVRWSSCNIFSTQDHAAAAIAAAGVPVFAWKGETEAEYEWCIEQTILKTATAWDANMILDDGGDLTLLVHKKYPQMLDNHSRHHRRNHHRRGIVCWKCWPKARLKVPAINVNDSVTKSKNDNKYGCRHSLNDAIKRGTDMLLAGRRALVIGYGDVGKGSAQSLRQEGMIVRVTEIDPICAMQACMDGYEVVSAYKTASTPAMPPFDTRLLGETDLIVTTTGNMNVCDARHAGCAEKMVPWSATSATSTPKSTPLYARPLALGRSEAAGAQGLSAPGSNVNPSDPNYLMLLSEGRLVNLGNATGHPSRIMDGSFANQCWRRCICTNRNSPPIPMRYKARMLKVEVLPKKLDEEVAAAMVAGFGGVLTQSDAGPGRLYRRVGGRPVQAGCLQVLS
jgi:adenosylhomocysteinase